MELKKFIQKSMYISIILSSQIINHFLRCFETYYEIQDILSSLIT